MPKKRQLAAIMFTDIEGYTALMQGDETQASRLREAHRIIFNSTTKKHGGKILQYYGDGTLSVFTSAIEAVNCGTEMQLAFLECEDTIEGKKGIPVRIGIHSGDIFYDQEEIIGDSVNLASRIESLASAGSVFISDKVYYEIKNQRSIETKSMGLFELKNVERHIEVFAISNEGLFVPVPSQIQGKAKRVNQKNSFFQKLWERGQPQLVAGYFASIWGLVGFTDWATNRYQFSPHWTDVMLVFFLSLLPLLFVFVWNIERIKTGKLNALEKLIVPGNLILSLGILFFIFKGVDLGATTKTVHFDNENGILESKEIIKPDFRTKLGIHNFLPEQNDTTQQWMSKGVHLAIAEDLLQNDYIKIGFWNDHQSLSEMITIAKSNFCDYSLTGTYAFKNGTYTFTSKLYQTQSGILKKTHTFEGADFFALIDTMSLIVKKDLELSQTKIDRFVDLPFDALFTTSLEAYKKLAQYIEYDQIKYLEDAIALDSTFAIANYVMANIQFGWSASRLGAMDAIDQGMRHRNRLSDKWKTRIKTLYFQVHDQPEKAIALLKMQLEINPDNPDLIRDLTQYLFLTAQYEDLLEWRLKLAALDNDPNNQTKVTEALLLNARFDEAEQVLLKTLERHPNHPELLGGLIYVYALKGETEKAESMLQKFIVLDPEFQVLAAEYSKAFQYAKNHLQTPESLSKYPGHFRMQRSAAEYDIHIIKNLLFGKGREHMSGFFFIPSGPDEFMMGGDDAFEKWTFEKDSLGNVYKIKTYRQERNQQVFNNVLWRQDTLINNAMALFSAKKQTEALYAFKMAYQKNPHHFYLKEYIKHLEFVLTPEYETELEKMRKYIGRYGPRHIWMEQDQFYYKRDGFLAKQQLLPISPDKFYFYGGFQFYMQVVLEAGKVKGTVSWEYNDTTGLFVRDDSDYIEFDKFKN